MFLLFLFETVRKLSLCHSLIYCSSKIYNKDEPFSSRTPAQRVQPKPSHIPWRTAATSQFHVEKGVLTLLAKRRNSLSKAS